MDPILATLAADLPGASCEQISSILSSLGKLKYRPHEEFMDLLIEEVLVKKAKLSSFTAKQLTASLYGLSMLNFSGKQSKWNLENAFLDYFLEVSASKVQ